MKVTTKNASWYGTQQKTEENSRAMVFKGEDDRILGHLKSRLCDGFNHLLQKKLINGINK